MSETLQQWFIREIISHEAALMRFMSRVWRDRNEIPDLRQEIYIRVYDAAAGSRPTNPRSFLFATARHLMTDRARRGKIVSIELKGDLDSLNVLIDEISPEQSIGARQELRQLAKAFDLLPAQCRDVMWLRKVEGLAQKDVAARLGINEKAVEKRLARGVRLLLEARCGDLAEHQKHDKDVLTESESGNG